MAGEERDNFFRLTLLLFRVGNQRLREYFKSQWPLAYQRVKPGTVPLPWQDTPHDATEMKKIQTVKLKFNSKENEKKFNSGDTKDWDFSLLTSVLKDSSLGFVLPSSPECNALDVLQAICITLIGLPTGAGIPNTLFSSEWGKACNALTLFNATEDDFKSVQDDVKKPLDVIYAILKQSVKQEKQEIQDAVNSKINLVWSPTKGKSNFARLCRLLIDGGTQVLRDVFDSIHSPSSLHSVLHSTAVHNTLQGLRSKKVLTKHQWEKLYPRIKTAVTSASFDISLLFVLLRNICGLAPPPGGWDELPVSSDLSKEADLVRMKLYRNELHGHITEATINDSDFLKYWREISNVLLRLGGSDYKQNIERLKVEALDLENERYFIKAVEEWEQLEKRLITKIDEVLKIVKSIQDPSQANVGEMLDQEQRGQKRFTTRTPPEDSSLPRTRDISGYEHSQDSKKLKESIKSSTEFQPKLMGSNVITNAKTDDIFTNLTVYYGKTQPTIEQVEGQHRRKKLQEYTKRSGITVKKFKDIFIDTKERNPKRLLLIGKPGIGKSLFCQKLIRDWAFDRLFENGENAEIPDIQFAYLLTFRQLNLLGNRELTLHELLKYSTDEDSTIDDSLFEYLVKNPSKVLIILDGFDEYSKQHRKTMAGDLEQKYLDRSSEKMPIPVLCSKLIKGRILRNSVLLISSRPSESDDLGNIKFDRHVEITGFSSQQVTEFVQKYFSKSEEETKQIVHEHIAERNENLVSFCHIPLLSFLLCWCLEWRITHSGKKDNLPSTTTDLYVEVVEVFVQKLHANLKYAEITDFMKRKAAQEIITKLADLAGNFLKESKYVFDEEDMRKLNLSGDEIENVKVSGILHCLPGIRISAFETKQLYSFTHLTLQEYLAAVLFVKNREIPKKEILCYSEDEEMIEKESISGQTLMFMAGLLSKKKDEKLMEKLLAEIAPRDEDHKTHKLLTLQCLCEYRDDELSKRTITDLFDKFCDNDKEIEFSRITGLDCVYVAYLLDIITMLNKQSSTQLYIVHALDISHSTLTASSVKLLCESLVRNSNLITKLWLLGCELDDECVEIVSNLLKSTKVTHLDLEDNSISNKGVESICKVLTDQNCCLKWLDLKFNDKITYEYKKYLFNLWVELQKPHDKLYI